MYSTNIFSLFLSLWGIFFHGKNYFIPLSTHFFFRSIEFWQPRWFIRWYVFYVLIRISCLADTFDGIVSVICCHIWSNKIKKQKPIRKKKIIGSNYEGHSIYVMRWNECSEHLQTEILIDRSICLFFHFLFFKHFYIFFFWFKKYFCLGI